MNLDHRHPRPDAARSVELFKAALESRGAPRGVRAERKGDNEGALYIYDNIGRDYWTGEGVDAKDVLARLDELKGVATLNIYINSPGGSVFDGKTIYNQLIRFGAKKVVRIDGIAASAASLIAMAGDRIITSEGGTWLIHRVSCGAYGFSEDLRKMADEIDAETVSIRGIYERRTGKSAAELDAWMLEDRIVDAATAKARGLTDEISEVEQRRFDEAAAAARKAAPVSLSPAALVAQARAQRLQIKEQFPAASRGAQQPGQPGAHKSIPPPDTRQKEQKR